MDIDKKEAARIFLSRQGLLHNESFGRGINAVSKAVSQLSWIQIDTISVVARAHHHVLQTRVNNYTPAMLHNLQGKQRQVFEYWSHAAAYLPLADYRYYLPVMAGSAKKRPPEKKLAKEILARIKAEGALQSKDFAAPPGRKSSGWWDWKPAKRVLEQLYLCGELMVSHREKFQKVYDLRERILPDHVDTSTPDEAEWLEFIVNRMLGVLGLGSEHDIAYSRTAIRQLSDVRIRQPIKNTIASMLEDKKIVQLDINGTPYYAHPDTLAELPLKLGKKKIRFLSPFDNLIINRARALALFDFDYQLECYVPEAKRKFGYFCLPILYGDTLIGRMDTKTDRKNGQLQIRNLVIDDGVKLDTTTCHALAQALGAFANSNLCKSVKILRTTPKTLKNALSDLLVTTFPIRGPD